MDEDLATEGKLPGIRESQGKRADGAYAFGDVLPDLSISPCDGLGEKTIAVDDLNAGAVDLGFEDVGEGSTFWSPIHRTAVKLAEVVFRIGIV